MFLPTWCLNLKLYLIILLTLAGCTSKTPEHSENDSLVRVEDIQPYIEQWDSNKEQIARLSAMEEDLSLLIQALALQTDIDNLPEAMKEQVMLVEHGTKQHQKAQQTPVQNVKNNEKPLYGVLIGRYLILQSAKSQMRKLEMQYPKLNEVIKYQVNEQQKESVTFYNLIAGPLQNQQQAAQLCLFFYNTGKTCSLTTFNQNL